MYLDFRPITKSSTSGGNLMTETKTKSRQTQLSLDKHTGRWCAKLGRKTTSGGNLDGHKFRFSTDRKESERRKGRIQELWDSIVEQECQDARWDVDSLAIAKAIEKGDRAAVFSVDDLAPIYMARLQVSTFRSQARLYAANVVRLQERFPQARNSEKHNAHSSSVAFLRKSRPQYGRCGPARMHGTALAITVELHGKVAAICS
jgi:hypothetical protein